MGSKQMRNWLSVELEKQPWLKAVVAQIFPLTDVNIEFKHGRMGSGFSLLFALQNIKGIQFFLL